MPPEEDLDCPLLDLTFLQPMILVISGAPTGIWVHVTLPRRAFPFHHCPLHLAQVLLLHLLLTSYNTPPCEETKYSSKKGKDFNSTDKTSKLSFSLHIIKSAYTSLTIPSRRARTG